MKQDDAGPIFRAVPRHSAFREEIQPSSLIGHRPDDIRRCGEGRRA
jgi:hypothetical protein